MSSHLTIQNSVEPVSAELLGKRNEVAGQAACVVDLDNLCHRGFAKYTGLPQPQARLDVLAFADALHRRGVTRGIVCRNKPFSALADQVWRQLRFDVLATRSNCDGSAIISLISLVE